MACLSRCRFMLCSISVKLANTFFMVLPESMVWDQPGTDDSIETSFMIAAKQPTFRSFSVVAILAQKLRKDFLGCWLKPSDDGDDALCAVEALQSKLSLQKPITTQLSRLSSFLTIVIIMFTFHIRKICIFYGKARIFSRSRQLKKLVAKVVHKTTESTLAMFCWLTF